MRAKLMLITAVIMGLVTTVLFFNYMKDYQHTAAASETMVEVIAANQLIPPDTVITPGMLQTVQVPALGVHPDAYRDQGAIVSKFAAGQLVPGEVIMPHHVKDRKEEALFVSKKVAEGHRAMSVGVNLVQSVSNLIEPGDYVDVVSTIPERQGEEDTVVSRTVLQKVKVLAIGRRMVEADTSTAYVEYATVTLEVLPADGVKVIQAGEEGIISLMLHGRIEEKGSE